MKKAVKIFNIISICCISFTTINLNATGGKLKAASIKTCNGTTYGYHADHWHRAVDRGSSGYYPDGDAIYSDPCTSNNVAPEPQKPSNNTSSNQQSSSSSTETQKTQQQETQKQETPKQETPKQDTTKQESTTTNKETSKTTNNTKTNTTTGTKNNSTTSKTEKQEEPPKEDTKKEEPKKNDDNTLKSIVVDGEKIEVNKKMEYKTTKKSVKTSIKTTDSNATYKIIGDKELVVGLNEYIIEITAEDGTKKEYELNITREKELSSNKNIKITVNDTELEFNNKKATTSVSNNIEKANIKYKLEDENTKVNIKGPEKLKVGDNEFKITITAEDNSKNEYTVIVNRMTKTEDTIYTILGLGLLGGIGYGFYWCYKKIKNVFKKVFK